jgi:sigma-B regulation protein RsbU (phosphoserine phosphatase)
MGALVRRARLPNDRRTPAAARALVRSVLEEAQLDALLNEALLLTTELSTNAVVHAGTELDIEVVADAGGLTVTVTDFAPGPVEQLTVGPRNDKVDIGEVAERGRGLLLVDHFASRWGTVHEGTGKGVWFRLERPGRAGMASASGIPAYGPATAGAPSVGALTGLLQIDPDRHTAWRGSPARRAAWSDWIGATGTGGSSSLATAARRGTTRPPSGFR